MNNLSKNMRLPSGVYSEEGYNEDGSSLFTKKIYGCKYNDKNPPTPIDFFIEQFGRLLTEIQNKTTLGDRLFSSTNKEKFSAKIKKIVDILKSLKEEERNVFLEKLTEINNAIQHGKFYRQDTLNELACRLMRRIEEIKNREKSRNETMKDLEPLFQMLNQCLPPEKQIGGSRHKNTTRRNSTKRKSTRKKTTKRKSTRR